MVAKRIGRKRVEVDRKNVDRTGKVEHGQRVNGPLRKPPKPLKLASLSAKSFLKDLILIEKTKDHGGHISAYTFGAGL
jgi:hypothetical protein